MAEATNEALEEGAVSSSNGVESPLLDIKEYRRRHKKAAWWCYSNSAVIISLLLTLIVVCIALPIKRKGLNVSGARRAVYIQAELVEWTYTTGGINRCHSGNYTGPGIDGDNFTTIGTFRKAAFRGYTDETFTTPLPVDDKWAHLGLLGPVIYAEAGDTIDVVFKNNINTPINLAPSGQHWNIPSLLPAVVPTRIVSYTWEVPEEAAPAAGDPQSSRLYMYKSTVIPTSHENGGLAGPLIVTRRGDAKPDGSAKDVDRDVVIVFQVFNERETPYAFENAADGRINTTEFARKGVNGHSWCTVPKLDMVVGERVRWHLASFGSEEGLHNFHWHGNVLTHQGHVADQVQAVPGSTISADMVPDNPGTWMVHCHVNEHLDGGMIALFNVLPPPAGSPRPLISKSTEAIEAELGGTRRVHYVMAEDIEWDYLPLGGDACGPAFVGPEAEAIAPFTDGVLAGPGNGTLSLGRKVRKAMFVEYTDDTFTTRVERPDYMGLLGPLLKAHVGDTLVVVLRNNASFPVTLHPHGVLYNKSSEGAPYNDGTSGWDKSDDAVLPGDSWTYIWHVPDRAGPGPKDSSSVVWMYHSHTDETTDTYAGLYGAILVYPRKTSNPTGPVEGPTDVDEEIVLFFSNMDEANSLYTDINSEMLLAEEAAAQGFASVAELVAGNPDAFAADNSRPSINGFMHCNLPTMAFEAGSRIRLHFMTLGSQADMHSPLVDGASSFIIATGFHTSRVQMMPGGMFTRDLLVAQQGTWRIQCGVQEHDGMRAIYQVVSPTLDSNSTSTGLLGASGGSERVWYVAAEEIAWDYAPGYNGSVPACTGLDFSPRARTYLHQYPGETIGHKSLKARYVLYTDASFTTRVPQPVWHGIQGPLLAAEVGDVITVVFKNMVSNITANLRPFAPLIAVNGSANGQLVESSQGAAGFAPAVEQGQTVTYRWYVPEAAGPGANDTKSELAYGYSSSVDPLGHENLGLVGAMVVACKGCLDWSVDPLHPVPRGFDAIVSLLWEVFDENASPFLRHNMVAAGMDPESVNLEDASFQESNQRHTINGWMYCTMPPVVVRQGARVRIIMSDFGAATALHSPFVISEVFSSDSGPAPTDIMMPGQAIVMDVVADKVGSWPMYCQVHDHMEAGMMGVLQIAAPSPPPPATTAGRRLLRG